MLEWIASKKIGKVRWCDADADHEDDDDDDNDDDDDDDDDGYDCLLKYLSYSLVILRNSLDGHKDKVYTIHNQYDDARRGDITRSIHNQKQAEVFDENSRYVCR